MTRQSWAGRLIRVAVLLAPGAALLQAGTSCGDQLRQTLIDSSVDAVGTATNQLLQDAIGGLLDGVQPQS